MNESGGDLLRITTHAGIDAYCAWSPGGLLMAFSSYRDGNWEIYLMNADGSNQHNITNFASHQDFLPAWSPDGTRIVFNSDRSGNFDIYAVNTDGANLVNLSDSSSSDQYPAWSPLP
jgi:Tol biopolymer transport system component